MMKATSYRSLPKPIVSRPTLFLKSYKEKARLPLEKVILKHCLEAIEREQAKENPVKHDTGSKEKWSNQ